MLVKEILDLHYTLPIDEFREALASLLEDELDAARMDAYAEGMNDAPVTQATEEARARLGYLRLGGKWQAEGGYVEGFENAMKIFGVSP